MAFTRQVTLKAPPKAVFQLLLDVTTLEEYTPWRVEPMGDAVGVGFQWKEKRGLKRRTWTVTAFDRRGFSMTSECNGLSLTMAAKKGGPGSCNVQMRVDGAAAAVAKFERSDGDRLDALKAWLDG